MREAYHVELENLATKLADMSAQVADAMERATKAMLESDLELAERVISDDALVDDARADCEEQAYALLALQAKDLVGAVSLGPLRSRCTS